MFLRLNNLSIKHFLTLFKLWPVRIVEQVASSSLPLKLTIDKIIIMDKKKQSKAKQNEKKKYGLK